MDKYQSRAATEELRRQLNSLTYELASLDPAVKGVLTLYIAQLQGLLRYMEEAIHE